jgi:methionyl-tRNA formyltransferase
MKPRIVLFGTPEFAAVSFRALLECGRYEIPLIVTQPDKPSGRGMQLTPPPVKILAEEFGVKVEQPVTLKGLSGSPLQGTETNAQLCRILNELAPLDIFIVVAYGKIIPRALLSFPRLGALNIHGSLLPRWRGAAPIHRALAAGDTQTGVCLMALEEGLDTGPVYSREIIELTEEDNFKTVHDTLAKLGADLLLRDLPAILAGELAPEPQPEEGITYAEKWQKTDQTINWQDLPEVTLNRIRASTPSPGARTSFKGQDLKVYSARLTEEKSGELPGKIIRVSEAGIEVATAGGKILSIREAQLAGRKKMTAGELIRGRLINSGEMLGC